MATTKLRANSVMAVVIDEVNRAIVFNVAGVGPDGAGKSITLRLADVNPANVAYAALHGFKQRGVDAAALSRNAKTGESASPADKFAAVEAIVNHYHSGSPDWNMRSAGGERTPSGDTALLIRAICELKGKSDAEVREFVKGKSASDRATLMIAPAIKGLIDRYREEVAGESDAEELLAELA